MKSHAIGLSVWIISLTPLFAQPVLSQPSNLSPREAGQTLRFARQRLQAAGLLEEFREALLAGIAFYPDEVVAAIFEVTQDPVALMREVESESPSYNQAHDFLSDYPQVLEDLRTHPLAMRVIGAAAVRDVTRAWEAIDDFRAKYRDRAGVSVADAVVADETPPSAVVPTSGQADVQDVTETTTDAVVVDFAPAPVYVEQYGYPGVVYVDDDYEDDGAVVVGDGVVVNGEEVDAVIGGGVVVGDNVVAGGVGGVAVTEDGDVLAGHAGAAVVETNNGAVAVGGAGYTQVDAEDGTIHHEGVVGAVNEDGQGAIAHREADTSWDENSLNRSVEGEVQTTGGKGAEWERDKSLEKTEEGFRKETSKQVETNDGRSAEWDKTVEKTDDGVTVDKSGSVTNREGETHEWDQSRDLGQSAQQKSAKSQPAANQASKQLQGAGQGQELSSNLARPETLAGQTGRAAALGASKSGWDYFQGGGDLSKASPFSRPQSYAKSKEAFSGRSLEPKQLNNAVSRGNQVQNRTFNSVESSLGARRGSKVSPQQPSGSYKGQAQRSNRNLQGGNVGGRSGGSTRGGGRRR